MTRIDAKTALHAELGEMTAYIRRQLGDARGDEAIAVYRDNVDQQAMGAFQADMMKRLDALDASGEFPISNNPQFRQIHLRQAAEEAWKGTLMETLEAHGTSLREVNRVLRHHANRTASVGETGITRSDDDLISR